MLQTQLINIINGWLIGIHTSTVFIMLTFISVDWIKRFFSLVALQNTWRILSFGFDDEISKHWPNLSDNYDACIWHKLHVHTIIQIVYVQGKRINFLIVQLFLDIWTFEYQCRCVIPWHQAVLTQTNTQKMDNHIITKHITVEVRDRETDYK